MMALLLVLLFAASDPFVEHGEKALVLLFVRTDCPISNRYAPEIERLHATYSRHGIDFRLVYPEGEISQAAMERHRREYNYSIPAVPDSGHRYVARAEARSTPEAAVFVHGQLIYRGRIDDRYVDFGKVRTQPARRDLEDVLAAIVNGKNVSFRETKAIGCAIEDLK